MSSKFSLVAKLPWLFCHRIRRVKRSLTMASQTSALTLKLKNSNFYIEMFLTESVWFSLFKVVKNIWQCIFAFAIHKIPRRCEVLKDLDVIDPDWFLIRKKLFISFASSPNLFFFRCSFFAANFFKEDWFLRRHHSVWQSSKKKNIFFFIILANFDFSISTMMQCYEIVNKTNETFLSDFQTLCKGND